LSRQKEYFELSRPGTIGQKKTPEISESDDYELAGVKKREGRGRKVEKSPSSDLFRHLGRLRFK
jgi:hypothetical protein